MKTLRIVIAVVALAVLTGCATLGGMFLGMGIGAMTGNAALGATIGASSGAVIDILSH
jgi:hypothetical protein